MINRKRITSICDNCNICGLPVITCICNSIKKVKTKSKFIILSSEREIYRNTNTASLLKLINIIVDGTWKEAWKIIRKSDYLKEVPILPLEVKKTSKFTLRRGQEEGNLCTIEAAIELLKINEENDIGEEINRGFESFLGSYKAGASGHKIN